MSLIDQSRRGISFRESSDDHLHAPGEFIHSIFEIIGDRRIHLHSGLDECIILISTHDVRQSERVSMDAEFLISSIEEFFSKYRSEIFDSFSLIIDKCCYIDLSLQFDVISEISDLFSTIYCDGFIGKLYTLSHQDGILFTTLEVRSLDPCLDLISRYTRELFAYDSLESIDFSFGYDVYFRIHSSEKWGIGFCIHLITIEFESWNREDGSSRDIAPRSDNTPSFI